MFLDTREHVAEFNNPGPALAIGDDELRQALRNASERVMNGLAFDNPRQARLAQRVLESERAVLAALSDRDGI